MAPRNPTADEEPDFEDESWDGPRTAIMEGGRTAEEAVAMLRQSWRTKHDRDVASWTEHTRLEQEAALAAREAQEAAAVPTIELPEPPEKSGQQDWTNLPLTPSFLDIKPARHILKRLEKKEFVELWHFTAEGCREAAAIDLATPDDTFGLVNTGGRLVLQTIGATTTSSKVIKDENLTWLQLTEAKTRMVGCLKACGWNENEISQLVLFYLSLDTHPIRSRPYGVEAVMRYQERVR